MASRPRPHVVIAGLMAVGKTTTAEALGAELGWPVRDSDTDIETLFGVTSGAVAAARSVAELHRLESAVLLGALSSDEPSVIAAASSVIEDQRCREALVRRAMVVVLASELDVLLARMGCGDHRRAMSRDEVAAAAARRAPLFAEIADLVLDAECSTAELVAAIVGSLDG